MDIQQKIVDIYTAAQNAKLQKDKEAKELLRKVLTTICWRFYLLIHHKRFHQGCMLQKNIRNDWK